MKTEQIMRIVSRWQVWLLTFCFFSSLNVSYAEEFLNFNRNEWQADTILPVYIHQWNADGDESRQVLLEYPEYEKITDPHQLSILRQFHSDLSERPEVKTSLGINRGERILTATVTPWIKKGKEFFLLTSVKLTPQLHQETASGTYRQTRATNSPERYATHSQLASGRWVKIRIPSTGIYKITHRELSSMGFSNPERVRLHGYGGHQLPESDIENCPDDLPEVPLWREGDYMLFYGRGPVSWEKSTTNGYKHTTNTYATHGYYFLTESDSIAPMPFPNTEIPVTENASEVTTTQAYQLYEKDRFNWMSRGRLFLDDENFSSNPTRNYDFNLTAVENNSPANLTVSFASDNYEKGTSSLTVKLNDKTLGTNSISYSSQFSKYTSFTKDFVYNGTLQTGKNTVQLIHTQKRDAYLDYIVLNYTRRLEMHESFFCFHSPTNSGKQTFRITQADAQTRVWNINGVRMTEYAGKLDGQTYTVTAQIPKSNLFVAVNTAASFPTVEVVGTVANQDLHALPETDLLIVIPASCTWTAQAERLAELHRKYDNLRVAVVRADQIYNEFSSGTPDATAIRRLMKMLYDRATTEADRPKHLLLFADGSSDNRMITKEMGQYSADNFLPTFQSVRSNSEVESYVMEEYFCLLDDGESAEVASTVMSDASVGRLPVRNLHQATTIVDKIEAYITNQDPGVWKSKILMLADDNDNTSKHLSDADNVAQVIAGYAPDMMMEKIYWDTYIPEKSSTGIRYPQITNRIYEALKEGVLMVNYSGHGRADALSHEYTWQLNDMREVKNSRLPLWFTAACDVTPFDLEEDNLGEVALFNTKGGGIGIVGTTRSVFPDRNEKINKSFCKYLFVSDNPNGHNTIGEALRRAKNEMVNASSINHLHYVLLGDPALKLAIPDHYQVVIDEFNGKSATDKNQNLQAHAGETITIKGCIVDRQGNIATGFNGLIYPTVYDCEETIEGISDNEELKYDVTYSFTTRNRRLFAGNDSIKQGQFTVTFPMPLDISYADEPGKMFLYAVNDKREEAQGSFEEFLIGGTADELKQDTVGPEIKAYFNSPDFTPGAKVHETPMLYLELFDSDGINATGNGLGHDLIAIIDNDPNLTFVLNNYYNTVAGDYSRGTVAYSLPHIAEGTHTLMVRAWDVMNNSSTIEVPFRVIEGLRPTLTNIWCTPGTATTETTFIIRHNRPQTQLDIKLEVFDFAGRILWEHRENATPEGNEYHISWNLTTNSGQPIGNGIYLYRATISSAGGSESTRTQKIAIGKQ